MSKAYLFASLCTLRCLYSQSNTERMSEKVGCERVNELWVEIGIAKEIYGISM